MPEKLPDVASYDKIFVTCGDKASSKPCSQEHKSSASLDKSSDVNGVDNEDTLSVNQYLTSIQKRFLSQSCALRDAWYETGRYFALVKLRKHFDSLLRAASITRPREAFNRWLFECRSAQDLAEAEGKATKLYDPLIPCNPNHYSILLERELVKQCMQRSAVDAYKDEAHAIQVAKKIQQSLLALACEEVATLHHQSLTVSDKTLSRDYSNIHITHAPDRVTLTLPSLGISHEILPAHFSKFRQLYEDANPSECFSSKDNLPSITPTPTNLQNPSSPTSLTRTPHQHDPSSTINLNKSSSPTTTTTPTTHHDRPSPTTTTTTTNLNKPSPTTTTPITTPTTTPPNLNKPSPTTTSPATTPTTTPTPTPTTSTATTPATTPPTTPTTTPPPPSPFPLRLLTLLHRYRSLAFSSHPSEGHGHHAATPPPVLHALHRTLGVSLEGFASPINAHFRRCCSAFPDTDACFGSLGSFFRFRPLEGSFEVGPPYVEEVMERAREHVVGVLSGSSRPLSFTVVIPEWRNPPTACIVGMEEDREGFVRRVVVVPQARHVFVDGAQHCLERSYFKPVHNTLVVVMQNEAGAVRWPATEEVEREILSTWAKVAEGVPENPLFRES